MPKKIYELEAQLKKAGFTYRPGKGSHRIYYHESGARVSLSGKPGDDAKRYQEADVKQALKQAGE